MWAYLVGPVVLGCAALAYEYRLRRPDCIVLSETRSGVRVRRGPFYPRHFSVAVRRVTQSLQLTIDAAAAGNVELRVRLAGTAAPSAAHLAELVRVGGWQPDAGNRAAEELKVVLQGLVKEFTERQEIQSLTSQGILSHLNDKAGALAEKLGLEIISLSVQSFEPANPQIAEALRQQEHARILEQTEKLNQQARSAAAKARIQADEEIAVLENDLQLRKAGLQTAQLDLESRLARERLQEELERNRMRLQFEKEELEMLKDSPELLLLTPQAARLAEASQSLKNARTIVSISPQELSQGPDLLRIFHSLLQKVLDSYRDQSEKAARV